MRTRIAVCFAVVLCSCRPSATVQRTTPVANLQPYQGVLVRGTGASARGKGRLVYMLERAAADRIRGRCAFLDVQAASQAEARQVDLILDVTVQRSYRGGEGLIQNENLATVDVKLVLSDGIDQELVGSADIQGKSAGIVINDVSPEEEAVGAVADSIADLLVMSGCTGPRVARANRTEDPGGEPVAEPVSDQRSDAASRAEAENDEGKRLFRGADVEAAKTHFEAAIALHRDPRFVFNLCLAEEALGELDAAVDACRKVIGMKPDKALDEKARLRLELIASKQK